MKKSKKILLYSISLAIVVLSVVAFILNWALSIKILVHPVLNLFLCLFVGFGLLSYVLGFLTKSPWYIFLGAVMFGLSVFYVLFALLLVWWVALVCTFAVWAISAVLSLIACGNKTEAIAENDKEGYKDYKQRKAEKIEAEENAPEVEKPVIKSFKK